MTLYRRKLIETALPLEAINRASAREKSIRRGHPATLHLWWSRKPLAACRAVLFASLVDDPASCPEKFPTREAQNQERTRLFSLLEALVQWDRTDDEALLREVREEIRRSCGGALPVVHDPFAGGGSIPLEARRLGLVAYASDLNPVAVLLNRALLTAPARFWGKPPAHPGAEKKSAWQGTEGLVEDILAYGAWVRAEAFRRVGDLYSSPNEKETIIAWIRCRAVRCPNPACGALMPLLSKLWLSSRRARKVWLEPVITRNPPSVSFRVKAGSPPPEDIPRLDAGTRLHSGDGRKQRAAFLCLCCQRGIAKGSYIDQEAREKRFFWLPLVVVIEGKNERLYKSADSKWESVLTERCKARLSLPEVQEKIPQEPAQGTFASNAKGRSYGFERFCDYFTPRQLLTLVTFTDLVQEARARVFQDAKHLDTPEREEYAAALALYLALAVDRLVDRHSTLCSWDATRDSIRNTFAQQGISIAWDFVEANPFSHSTGNFQQALDWITEVLRNLPPGPPGMVMQADSAALPLTPEGGAPSACQPVFVTDPPYYDNVSYASLSDFFFVWMKRSLGPQYPELFSTSLSPKQSEIVASPQRFNFNKERAKEFFEESLKKTFLQIHALQNRDFPFVLFYAFTQREGTVSTGWETLLSGLLEAGFLITGTWPVRTELANRNVSRNANALHSSIVLVCRPRPPEAPVITRRAFLSSLRKELPEILFNLRQANIAPVDLAQAAIGPGMSIFSRCRKVLEPDGSPMSVRDALECINRIVDEILQEQEGEFEPDTRFALAWFAQFAFEEGPFGDAELLSKAKNTSVQRLVERGILLARAGKARLLTREELPQALPTEPPPALWRATQHLICTLESAGEEGAARALQALGSRGEEARHLAYLLYSLCQQRRWPKEALSYHSLVVAWPEIAKLAQS